MALLLNEIVTDVFWKHPDFWIEFILAIIGALIGLFAYNEAHKAFTEAGKAKDAAIKAGKTVKKQSILLSISETIRLCQIRGNTNYEDSNTKLMEICGKIRNIIGLFKLDIGQSHQELLHEIETCSSNVQTEFNLLDPDSDEKTIYNKLRPFISTLAGHLNELQGVLENELISNN
jgi:hypothetical protein